MGYVRLECAEIMTKLEEMKNLSKKKLNIAQSLNRDTGSCVLFGMDQSDIHRGRKNIATVFDFI